MKLSELSQPDFARRMRAGLRFVTGPFIIDLRSSIQPVAHAVQLLYGRCELAEQTGLADFHVSLVRPPGLRRWLYPQVSFLLEGQPAFTPFPLRLAIPLMEWGMNYCIFTLALRYVTIHAAAVEKRGRVMVLPAPPGSGKSTLCAAMIHRGWRLLSDEITLLRPEDGRAVGLARPVNLKNNSPDIIRTFAPEARFSPRYTDTAKGAVSYLYPPQASVDAVHQPALPAWLVFPLYRPGSALELTPMPKADALMELGRSAFNATILGQSAFETMARMIDQCDCYNLVYSNLDDAIAAFDRLPIPPVDSSSEGGRMV